VTLPLCYQVTDEWSSRELNLVPYKGITERLTYILGGAEDLLVSLDDSLISLSIIKASSYVAPIKVRSKTCMNLHHVVLIYKQCILCQHEQ